MAKKIYCLTVIAAWVLGTVGGFAWCAYNRAWLIALAVLALGAMAFPFVRDTYRKCGN